MSTQTDTIEIRLIATELILDAAREVDALAVSEHLEEQGTDDPGDGLTEQILELIRTATVTVDWPAAEPGEPTAGIDLDAIEARANAATDGPWEHSSGENGEGDGLVWPRRLGDPVSASIEMPDAEFIAAARTDVPALAAEVRRLRAVLDEITHMCECRNGDLCASAKAHYALHGPSAHADA